MTPAELSEIYRGYIACLNRQDWNQLGRYVDEDVFYNGRRIGLAGYRGMLEKDFSDIPDLSFEIDLLVSEPPHVASRLVFQCTPKGKFLGLDVDGRTVSFSENVFYRFKAGRIDDVRSIIDKAAVEAQL